MATLTRRALYYLFVLVATTVLFTVAYSVGMSAWEGRPRPWYRSLEVVLQTFTTTGYGEDAPWQSPEMNVLVILMQLTGIGFILSAVDVFVVPWLREALRPTAPTSVSDHADHVVVCGFTSRVEVFIAEMEERGHDYVLVEPDSDRSRSLYERGYPVMEGDPESAATLERAHVASAKVVVADVADDINASIVLAAREAAPEGRVITLVEDASLAQYHRAAGADVALSPRQLLGRTLAAKVPLAAAASVEESVTDGEPLNVVEVVVTRYGPLYGRTLDELRLSDRFEIHVIGAWVDGTFEVPLPRNVGLAADTHLFVAGTPDGLAALRDEMAPYVRAFEQQSIVLAGYGDSGRAAHTSLEHARADVTVVDVDDREGVDVVGDVRDPDVLRTAGIEEASALIVAIGDDTAATFTTLIARDLNADLQILVRAQDGAAVQNLHRAGADFVEALPTVCGQMLAATVFEGEHTETFDPHLRVARLRVPEPIEGGPADIKPDAQTNVTVLAVRRDDAFVVGDDADSTLEAGDEVIVAGTEDGVRRVTDRLNQASSD